MALICFAVALASSLATTGTRHGNPTDVHQRSQPSRLFRRHTSQPMPAPQQRRAIVRMTNQDSLAAVGDFDDKWHMAQRGGNLAIPDEPAALDDAVNGAADAARGAADAAKAAADAAKAAVDAAKAVADATQTVVDAAPAAAGAAPAAADSMAATAVAQIAADGAARAAEITAAAQKEVAQIAQIAAEATAHSSTINAVINAGAQKEAAEATVKAAHIMAEAGIVVAVVSLAGMAVVSKVNNGEPIWTKGKQVTPPPWSMQPSLMTLPGERGSPLMPAARPSRLRARRTSS